MGSLHVYNALKYDSITFSIIEHLQRHRFSKLLRNEYTDCSDGMHHPKIAKFSFLINVVNGLFVHCQRKNNLKVMLPQKQ